MRQPLPLPARIDPEAISDFDYRRVECRGRFRHDLEMLIGPRMRDGEDGYMVVTPLERKEEGGSTVLVNRGWIPKRLRDQRKRAADALPDGEVVVEGLLRKPWKKNMFTPENRPDKGEFYFPDVKQMAELTGAQPVWIEATMGRSPEEISLKALSIHMLTWFRSELHAGHGVRAEGNTSQQTSRGQLEEQPCSIHLHLVRQPILLPSELMPCRV